MSYRSFINTRSLLVLLACASALLGPWWLPLTCMVILAVLYPSWEILIVGLLIDLAWLPIESVSLPLFTIAGIVLVWIFVPLRRKFLT